MEPPDVLGASEARYKQRRKKDEDDEEDEEAVKMHERIQNGSSTKWGLDPMGAPMH